MTDISEAIQKQTSVVKDLRRRIRELEDEEAKKERVVEKAEATKKKLSDKERDEIRAIFDEYDTDKSGSLEPQEVSECAAKLGAKMTPEELDAAVKALDANKDGKISFDEFVEWFTSDSKLGGLSGPLLTAVRLKMRMVKAQQAATSHLRTLDRSEGVGYSFSLHTTRPFEPKFTISATAIPLPEGMPVDSPAARKAIPDFEFENFEAPTVIRVSVRCEEPVEFIESLKELPVGDGSGCLMDEVDPNVVHLYIAFEDAPPNPLVAAFGSQPVAISINTPKSFEDFATALVTSGPLTALSEFNINTTASINPQLNFLTLISTLFDNPGAAKKIGSLTASLFSRGAGLSISCFPIQHGCEGRASSLVQAAIEFVQKRDAEVDITPLQTPEFATFMNRALELSYAPNLKNLLLERLVDDIDALDNEEEIGDKFKPVNFVTSILRKGGVTEVMGATLTTNDTVLTLQTAGLNVKHVLSLLPEGEGKNGEWARRTLEEIKDHFAIPSSIDETLIRHLVAKAKPVGSFIVGALNISKHPITMQNNNNKRSRNSSDDDDDDDDDGGSGSCDDDDQPVDDVDDEAAASSDQL